MVYYTVSIFQAAGSTIESSYATVIVDIVQFVFTALSGFFVIIYLEQIFENSSSKSSLWNYFIGRSIW